MLKRITILFLTLAILSPGLAQDGNTAFHILKLPFSSHAGALGGENISIVEDDITLAVHNPALLSYISDKTLNLNYMSYINDTKVGSAAFGKLLGARSSWAVSAQYVDYGKFDERNEEGVYMGEFPAKDIVLSGLYAYDLSDYWAGGVKANFIYSTYEKYTSFAIGVDLGLNYYHNENGLSFSIVARNLGGQIVAFEDRHEKLPFDLQVGVSKSLLHAPFRFSATLHQLTSWGGKINKKAANHLIIGADYKPTNNFYISLGYNFKRADEMKVEGSSRWTGLSMGAGIHIKKIKLGAAYAKYHPSASSLLMNLSLTL